MKARCADDELVLMSRSTHDAGRFALARYRQRHRAWLRRVWWIFALVAIAPLAAAVGVGWLLNAGDMQFLWGAGLGGSATALMMLTGPTCSYRAVAAWR
ncbi:MAG: hypothetical protein JO304_13090 [Solirubrobacterales bacterium]|nr:hypothetical protein [Solirubrobacterales bacterium]